MTKKEYPSIGETLYTDTLPNGLKISVITKPGFVRNCAMFAARVGGADRRFTHGGEFIEAPAGVAHFLEHKMWDMPDGENIMAAFASSGARDNAYTSSAVTAYYFEGTDRFEENLRTLIRFVSTPHFTEETVAKEQGIIAQEIRMGEDDPFNVGLEELMKCLYAVHPVRESVIGTVESISAISHETLYRCHRAFYNPANMCLSVVGDVDPEAVCRAAAELLPAAQGEKPVSDYGGHEDLLPAKKRFTKAMAVSAPQFAIGAKLPHAGSGEALLRQKLVCGMALSYLYGRSSPFYTGLYAEGLVNEEFFMETEHAAGTFTFFVEGESRDPEAVYAAVCRAAAEAAEKGMDIPRFERLKKAGYGSRIRALSSFWGLCDSMADAAFGGYNCLDSFAMVESISHGEVREFIAQNLKEERFAMSVITPADTGKEAEE